jgi:putative PEP-CTERM system histidine kinase
VVGLVLTLSAGGDQVFQWTILSNSRAAMTLGAWGQALYMFIVIGTALGLAQLEVVLRASREPFRHKLKFIAIGLGGLAGYQIYQASRMLLFSVLQAEQEMISTVVTLMALGLIAIGLWRSRLRAVFVHAHVSHQALVGSVTFIVIGLYLVAVGAVGTWLRETNQPLGIGLSVVVVFGAIVGLVVAAFSKTVRAELRRFITRNFYRSKYDYRAEWLRITEAFQEAADDRTITDRLLDVLIKTFPTTHVSIWAFREADRRFCCIRSMTGEAEPEPIERSHPIIAALEQRDDAVLLNTGSTEAPAGRLITTDSLRSSGAVLCFPIRAQGRVISFIALGPQRRGEPYGTDDEDLLRGIAHHVGMLLARARLVEERRASAEVEALHRFSVFCLHDLKNLAARLSLVAQNAQRHGSNPAFQESAMRTVADTADKMALLMSKLSQKSFQPGLGGAPEPVDLSELIHEIVEPLQEAPSFRLQVIGHMTSPVIVVREQIQQVLLNVVLNAQQAITQDGEIVIALAEADGYARVTVADTGCGIPPGKLENLFKPSQSGRPGGLGVGLYQCKQIVDAHRGTIRIRSEAGKGTEVTIELPLAQTADHREAVAAREG